MDKPYYPYKAIGSIDTLARTIGVSSKRLVSIANKADESYTPYILKNKNRTVFEPKYELKKVQKRLNSRIFELVEYPVYLQGGIKADIKRDYVENAKIHVHAQTLISLDIKKFFTNIKREFVFAIYKNFFNFPEDVSEILTKITTYKGMVPQGGCTSTYLANLIFFNSEYLIVSALRGQGINYSRLLDDVTLSSKNNLNNKQISELIKKVTGMFIKYQLKLNNKKTKIEYRGKANKGFEVTGLWVEPRNPKLRRKERHYIRQLVYVCEKKYAEEHTTREYHELWNMTSGKVAKMSRLEHHQAVNLRKRLKKIMPSYDENSVRKLKKLVSKAIHVPKDQRKRIGRIKNYNKLIYKLGILKRTHKSLAKKLKTKLKSIYINVPTKREYWLE